MLKTQFALEPVARELNLREDELIAQAVQVLLEHNLRRIEAQIFEIAGHYSVASVAEMDDLYRNGELDESDSWRDYQRLDHLEYKRDRLTELLRSLT